MRGYMFWTLGKVKSIDGGLMGLTQDSLLCVIVAEALRSWTERWSNAIVAHGKNACWISGRRDARS